MNSSKSITFVEPYFLISAMLHILLTTTFFLLIKMLLLHKSNPLGILRISPLHFTNVKGN